MAPFSVTPPRKPRAHALSLAESLLGPRVQTVDADRVGLDPLLRSHLSSMSEGIDGLLRRAEPVPAHYDSQGQTEKVHAGAQHLPQTPPRLRSLPPGMPENLVNSLISGLATEDVSVSDAVGTLESDLRSPNSIMTAPARLGITDPEAQATKVMECDRCSVMALQVRALAQSLAGLGAQVFNWSSELKPTLRRQLADTVLRYTLPCVHIDKSIQHLCDELSSTRWESAHDVDETKKSRNSRASATWHWWDSDPANLGLTPIKKEETSGSLTSSLEAPGLGAAGAKAFKEAGVASSDSLTIDEQVFVNVMCVDGSAGLVQLQLILFDAANDDDAVIAASSQVQVEKKQVSTVEMFPDMTVEQNGVSYQEMEEPCFAIIIDEAATPDLVMDDEGGMIEVSLGHTVDIIVKAKKKKGGFWSRLA